ncbi:helix-turn-helix domain-containing protein [Rossellomorea sp. KS-H15a]|uniref:helix-turn-helix domain-containing protein n=1 Tax=Rossellomorea sp. KS-H15a TaxID=2963940 RepID=UPI0020C68E90|nr:helix-turn-helix domain-containing protein [Rossellomorea sp. KS-H15a]UTE77539.1 helix-turn-helix domain-containing protein [Rossellomorea sp. KS-H15a]
MVGDRIKGLREEMGLTINELANLSNVSKSYISSIERGIQKNPSIKVLRKIATSMDSSLEEILSTDKRKVILDEEWIEPLEKAIQDGLTKEEFKDYLSFVHYKRRKLHNE